MLISINEVVELGLTMQEMLLLVLEMNGCYMPISE
jgi:hypothetical protein